MLQLMLCGAHDVREVANGFRKVAKDFGASPLFYQYGTTGHVNSLTSNWPDSSRATVRRADICIFVILNNYGNITWSHELQEALELGKPFIVLALESAWIKYKSLLHTFPDSSVIPSTDDQRMVDLLRLLTFDYNIAVIPFSYDSFSERLQTGLSSLFEEAVRLVEIRSQRSTLLARLGKNEPLTALSTVKLIELAKDELETDKLARKTALSRLAAERTRDRSLVDAVCRSHEQGVQRLAFSLLADLLPLPLDSDLLGEVARVAGDSDDVGVQRRFIEAIVKVDVARLDFALSAFGNAEIGIRRRAFEAVENRWMEVLEDWGTERMRSFLKMCEMPSGGRPGWLDRLRSLRDELETN